LDNRNCPESDDLTTDSTALKVTRRPHYDADATKRYLNLLKTAFSFCFLRKISLITAEVTNMQPAKEFRAAREAYFRLLFASVDEQFFSFLTGFIL